jgi:hypothetical protein
MTHSGGKPHAVGDRGQQYEITFFDPDTNERLVLGWTDDIVAAQGMSNGIEQHPSWCYPQIRDRRAAP